MAPPVDSPAPRVAWVDAAKALAIVLVVVYHVSGTGMTHLAGAEDAGIRFWRLISASLVPVRMPLFFLASGLLAVRALERPWPRLIRPRVTNLLWPFVLWSIVFALIGAIGLRPDAPGEFLRLHLAAIPVGGTAYWYLTILVVFFVIARSCRRWPELVLVGSVAALGLAPRMTSLLTDVVGLSAATNISRLGYFSIWFFLGCFGHQLIHRVQGQARLFPLMPFSILVYATLAFLVYVAKVSIASVFLTIVGLVASLSIARWVVGFNWTPAVARYLAARTLPIYVLHPVMLNAMIFAHRSLESAASILPKGTQMLFMPVLVAPVLAVPLISIGLTGLAVLCYDAVQGTPMARLFSPPLVQSAPASDTRQPSPAR